MPVNKQPLISIVTVVLNAVQTLEKTLQSVFQQNFTDYEYIVVDGGSTDGTIDIIRRYDKYISLWLNEPDHGVYDAMNKSVRLAKGQWIYFLGADDFLLCNLESVAHFLKDKQTIYYGDVIRPVINRKYDGYFSAYKLACRNICHQSIFYPKRVFDNHLFDLKYPVFADYELNMRLYSDQNITYEYIPITIAVFHDEGGLSPSRQDKAFEAARLSLIKKNFSFTVYLLSYSRFYFIEILNQLRLKKIAMRMYHLILRYLQFLADKLTNR